MDDNNLTKTIIENSGDTINQFYNDAVSPTAKAVGNIVALPFQAIDASLSEAKLWVIEKQFNYERTRELLAEKLKSVPKENIVPPEKYVAVPALQQISYCFDSNELRDMYANLLASSMQKDKKWEIHPAFVDIIKQLTPDEAKIIKALVDKEEEPVISLIAKDSNENFEFVVKNYSLIGNIAGCYEFKNISLYLDNLLRLGIIENTMGNFLISEDKAYESICSDEYIKLKMEEIKSRKDSYNIPDFHKGFISLTEFGKKFCRICVL